MNTIAQSADLTPPLDAILLGRDHFYRAALNNNRAHFVSRPLHSQQAFFRSLLAESSKTAVSLPEVVVEATNSGQRSVTEPLTEPVTEKVPEKETELVTDVADLNDGGRPWSVRLQAGLAKTRGRLSDHLASLLKVGGKIDAQLLDDIECELLAADVGIEATDRLIEHLQSKLSRRELADSEAIYGALQAEMVRILSVGGENPLNGSLQAKPFVLLVVGVNGVGKTTTIGKIAHQQCSRGRQVMLAAGDTFRAAAIDQLKTWGDRLAVPVVAQNPGADSASVIYDAIQSAQAKNVDVIIADTAGRLHTQSHLMDELKKVKRVIQKIDAQAPHATLLVLDAGNGQNALNQARAFHEAMSVDGIALTKLDGTARGGISFAICEALQLPLWFIGVGEQREDLRPFDASDFVGAILSQA